MELADEVQVTSIVDNYTDLVLASGGRIHRPPLGEDERILPPLAAEHGFSALVQVSAQEEEHVILFDAGASGTAFIQNVRRLGIDVGKVEAVALSHGHYDHFGGLTAALREISKRDVPLIVHPEAFLQRWLIFRNGKRLKLPVLNEKELVLEGVRIVKSAKPCWIGGDSVLVSGEIARRTDFERGLRTSYVEMDGQLRKDPLIRDEQSLAIAVKRKGLVVISGCGHPGIINTIVQAQETTGVRRVHAVMGGFHLNPPSEHVIKHTLSRFLEISPRIIAPSHCTGWQATHAILRAMPRSFVQNTVGSRFSS